jgi:DNA-binding transcriptional regulator WhiA
MSDRTTRRKIGDEVTNDLAEKKLDAANTHRRDRAARAMVPKVRRALEQLRRRGMRGVKVQTLVIARLRVDNPKASLNELAAMVQPPTTKHTVAGRLRRFVREFADD